MDLLQDFIVSPKGFQVGGKTSKEPVRGGGCQRGRLRVGYPGSVVVLQQEAVRVSNFVIERQFVGARILLLFVLSRIHVSKGRFDLFSLPEKVCIFREQVVSLGRIQILAVVRENSLDVRFGSNVTGLKENPLPMNVVVPSVSLYSGRREASREVKPEVPGFSKDRGKLP